MIDKATYERLCREGLKLPEIARRAGMSPGALRQHMHAEGWLTPHQTFLRLLNERGQEFYEERLRGTPILHIAKANGVGISTIDNAIRFYRSSLPPSVSQRGLREARVKERLEARDKLARRAVDMFNSNIPVSLIASKLSLSPQRVRDLISLHYDSPWTELRPPSMLVNYYRDLEIIESRRRGESMATLARRYGISPQRVSQICGQKLHQ